MTFLQNRQTTIYFLNLPFFIRYSKGGEAFQLVCHALVSPNHKHENIYLINERPRDEDKT